MRNTFSIVSFGPIVSCSRVSKDKVVWPKKLSVGPGSDRVHGAGLKVKENGAGHVLAPTCLVVVDIDPLQLQIRGAIVVTSTVDAMLIRYDFPELVQKE